MNDPKNKGEPTIIQRYDVCYYLLILLSRKRCDPSPSHLPPVTTSLPTLPSSPFLRHPIIICAVLHFSSLPHPLLDAAFYFSPCCTFPLNPLPLPLPPSFLLCHPPSSLPRSLPCHHHHPPPFPPLLFAASTRPTTQGPSPLQHIISVAEALARFRGVSFCRSYWDPLVSLNYAGKQTARPPLRYTRVVCF